METLKFEQLPTVIASLTDEIKELKAFLLHKSQPQPEIETPIQLDKIIPLTGLSKPTIYGYVQRNEIPYHKKGNRLYFFKSEIIKWIRSGKVKSMNELEADVDTYLSNKSKGLK